MNAGAVRAIVGRDLARVASSRATLLPLVGVPLVLLGGVPLAVGLLARAAGTEALAGQLAELRPLLDRLPPGVAAAPPGGGDVDRLVAVALVHLLAPLYLVVPLLVATVVAADGFAGERERRTLEGLLVAPVTDAELLVAKVLAAWVPAVAVGAAGAVVYGAVADLVTGRLLFPNLLWAGLALWAAPGVAALGLAATVVVSGRVATAQAANQVAGVVVVPLLVVLVAQATGALLLSPGIVVALGAAVWAAAGALLLAGARALRRTALGERL